MGALEILAASIREQIVAAERRGIERAAKWVNDEEDRYDIADRMLAALLPPAPQVACVCGESWKPGTHRQDGPCLAPKEASGGELAWHECGRCPESRGPCTCAPPAVQRPVCVYCTDGVRKTVFARSIRLKKCEKCNGTGRKP